MYNKQLKFNTLLTKYVSWQDVITILLTKLR